MDFQLEDSGTIELQLEDNGETTLQLGGEIKSFSDIVDINFTDLQDNQILQYNSTTGNWENKNTDILGTSWGGIIGNISDQTDLWNELTNISTSNFKNSKIYISENNDSYIHENADGDIELVKNGQWVQRW